MTDHIMIRIVVHDYIPSRVAIYGGGAKDGDDGNIIILYMMLYILRHTHCSIFRDAYCL